MKFKKASFKINDTFEMCNPEDWDFDTLVKHYRNELENNRMLIHEVDELRKQLYGDRRRSLACLIHGHDAEPLAPWCVCRRCGNEDYQSPLWRGGIFRPVALAIGRAISSLRKIATPAREDDSEDIPF